MTKILSEKEIGENLKKVIAALNLTQQAFGEKIGEGKRQAISNYINCTGGKKPSNLVTKLVQIGINGNWYLTGKGDMYASESTGDVRQEKAGKLLAEAIQLLSEQKQEEKLSLVAEDPKTYGAAIESIPLYAHTIAAGPATDSTCPVEEHLDLPKHMIAHPAHTYAVKASGDSMKGSGIEEGDILIVDTAIEAQDKSIVIASVNGEQTVKRLSINGGKIKLMPENSHYEPIEISKGVDFKAQGVVTWVIRKTG